MCLCRQLPTSAEVEHDIRTLKARRQTPERPLGSPRRLKVLVHGTSSLQRILKEDCRCPQPRCSCLAGRARRYSLSVKQLVFLWASHAARIYRLSKGSTPQLRTKATMTLSTVQPAFRPFKLATISVALEPSEVRQSLVQRKIDYLAEMYCSSSGCSLAKPS
jgi:hypothetical protein